jgi:hypothetical protein
MPDDATKKLEMRIIELEDQLKELRARREPDDVSADEIRAYQKVRQMISADWGDFCGINDCMRCLVRLCGPCIKWPSETISRCVHLCACIIECSCGPCNVGGFERGGLSRFSGLGG